MKLLIITSIKEFLPQMIKILQSSGVHTFSYRNVTGFRDSTLDAVDTNWFATEINETESVLFFAFVQTALVDKLMQEVNRFNRTQDNRSRVHIVVVAIEKSNE